MHTGIKEGLQIILSGKVSSENSAYLHEFTSKMQITGAPQWRTEGELKAASFLLYLRSRGPHRPWEWKSPKDICIGSPIHNVKHWYCVHGLFVRPCGNSELLCLPSVLDLHGTHSGCLLHCLLTTQEKEAVLGRIDTFSKKTVTTEANVTVGLGHLVTSGRRSVYVRWMSLDQHSVAS